MTTLIDSTIQQYQACIDACNKCIQACEEYLSFCLKEPDVQALIHCIGMLTNRIHFKINTKKWCKFSF